MFEKQNNKIKCFPSFLTDVGYKIHLLWANINSFHMLIKGKEQNQQNAWGELIKGGRNWRWGTLTVTP